MVSRVIVAAVLLLGATPTRAEAACGSRPAPTHGDRLARPAGKGVELYSWNGPGGSLSFSLLWGTNRNKTDSEVLRTECVLPGIASLKAALARLAVGEHVFWVPVPSSRDGRLALPPSQIVDDLRVHCSRLGIKLELVGPGRTR